MVMARVAARPVLVAVNAFSVEVFTPTTSRWEPYDAANVSHILVAKISPDRISPPTFWWNKIKVLVYDNQTFTWSQRTEQEPVGIYSVAVVSEVLDLKWREEILQRSHNAGHFDLRSSIKQIRAAGHDWRGLHKDMAAFIRKCPQCNRWNAMRARYDAFTPVLAWAPNEHWAVDDAGMGSFPMSENGYVGIRVFVCVLTNYVFLRPIRTLESAEFIQQIIQLGSDVGFPRIIQTDNATTFASEFTKTVAEKLDIQLRFITAYHPQANGKVERMVRVVKNVLNKILDGEWREWESKVPFIQTYINARISESTEESAFALFFARRPFQWNTSGEDSPAKVSAISLEERLKVNLTEIVPAMAAHRAAKQQRLAKQMDAKRLPANFKEGQIVYIRNTDPKSLMPFDGPFTIARRTQGNSYLLMNQHNELHPTKVSALHIKPVERDEPDDEIHYEVERILSHRTNEDNVTEYEVKWKGYPHSDNLWITKEDFDSVSIIDAYWKQQGSGRRGRGRPSKSK